MGRQKKMKLARLLVIGTIVFAYLGVEAKPKPDAHPKALDFLAKGSGKCSKQGEFCDLNPCSLHYEKDLESAGEECVPTHCCESDLFCNTFLEEENFCGDANRCSGSAEK